MAKTKIIKKRMIDRGLKNRDFVKNPGRSDSLVSDVIHGWTRSAATEKAIARKLKVPRRRLFPRGVSLKHRQPDRNGNRHNKGRAKRTRP